MERELRTVRQRFVNIYILSVSIGITTVEINSIMKEIVKVDCREGILTPEQTLLYTRLESPVFFRFQVRVWQDKGPGKRLFKARLLDTCGI